MIYINVPTTEGDRREKVYSIADFPYNKFAYVKTSVKHGKNPVIYLELSAAFDIETTNITDAERPWAFMYQWQFCVGDDVCFSGMSISLNSGTCDAGSHSGISSYQTRVSGWITLPSSVVMSTGPTVSVPLL